MAKEKSSIELCIYYDEGLCYLSSYATPCTLCMNYKSAYPIGKKKKIVYDIFDLAPDIFTEGSDLQSRLF
ncbi:hypothetical protein [Thermoplasma acidophilum]|uniref:hypothetical protein n=1 Tax=Thermoplasma acidophilum TaxID=2303 RepID=UPI00064FE91E|nr:hypothetical protein [Thermoplasma acidophilum]